MSSRKKRLFIIDHDLGDSIREYLPAGEVKRTTEYGLPSSAKDPSVVDLCTREEAILVTADAEFPVHFAKYQKAHNTCCWGLLLLPDGELNQIRVLQRFRDGKLQLSHPKLEKFTFEEARHSNLFVNLRANPPQVGELCDCEWE